MRTREQDREEFGVCRVSTLRRGVVVYERICDDYEAIDARQMAAPVDWQAVADSVD